MYKSVCNAHFTYGSGSVCKNQYVTLTLHGSGFVYKNPYVILTLHMDLDLYVKIGM